MFFIEIAEELLGEIYQRSCRALNLLQALVTLSNRQVAELGLDDLQAVNEVAEVTRDIVAEIIAATDIPNPIGRARSQAERQ